MDREKQWLLEEKYGGKKCDAFFADVRLLESGVPLGYVIGFVPFLDTRIHLDSHPLIPRVETEYWTKLAIETINDSAIDQPVVLDLCAGSGCIGVAIAKHGTDVAVDFAEIDKKHHATIRKNLEENTLSSVTTHIFGGDLFSDIPERARYHFILTNPPYIDPTLNRTDELVRKHEPHQALYGGKKGFEVIATIIHASPKYLASRGQLWIEHEPEQRSSIENLALKNNFLCTTRKDQYDVERYSILVLQ